MLLANLQFSKWVVDIYTNHFSFLKEKNNAKKKNKNKNSFEYRKLITYYNWPQLHHKKVIISHCSSNSTRTIVIIDFIFLKVLFEIYVYFSFHKV